jgi:hypothetical protein
MLTVKVMSCKLVFIFMFNLGLAVIKKVADQVSLVNRAFISKSQV